MSGSGLEWIRRDDIRHLLVVSARQPRDILPHNIRSNHCRFHYDGEVYESHEAAIIPAWDTIWFYQLYTVHIAKIIPLCDSQPNLILFDGYHTIQLPVLQIDSTKLQTMGHHDRKWVHNVLHITNANQTHANTTIFNSYGHYQRYHHYCYFYICGG